MSAKQLAYRALSTTCRLLSMPPTPDGGQRVLLFHSVGTEIPGDSYGLSLTPTRFTEYLDRVVSLREWTPAPFAQGKAAKLEVALVFDDGFKDTLTIAAPLLAARKLPFTVFVTAGFVRDDSAVHLSRAELKELAAFPGATIGAHGLEHVSLPKTDDTALRRELMDSRKFLEDLVAKPVVTMSYPHGHVDRRVADAAKGAGYLTAGCSRYGLNESDRDPLLLQRTEITAFDSVDDLELKLRGHWDWFGYRHPDVE